MCQSGCKCKTPCPSCSCSKQGLSGKPVTLQELQAYTKRHSEVVMDETYFKGLAYLAVS